MSHVVHPDLLATVSIAPESTVSKVLYRDDLIRVVGFGFDRGEELTEHTSNFPAIVEVISGRLAFSFDGEETELGPGSWAWMEAGLPHSLRALEPTVMLLTLLRGAPED